MKNQCESMMLCCFNFSLCFSRELDRSRWSRCSRAFAKTVNELLHTQFRWILTDRWFIRKLEKNLSSLKSKILIIRCDCLVVVCGLFIRLITMLFFWYVLKWYFWLTYIWKNDVNILIKSFSQIFKNQLMISFDLHVLFEFNFFMISITFFFTMIDEQWINDKYIVPTMSLRSAESGIQKNSSTKNHVLFSKNVFSFSSTSFCVFLISVGIFNNSLKTWLLILIHFFF